MMDRSDRFCTLTEHEARMLRHHLDRIEFFASYEHRERQIWQQIDRMKELLGRARDREFETPFRLRGGQ